jgi:hypothetical protein
MGSPDITCSTVIIVMLAPMPRPMARIISDRDDAAALEAVGGEQ